MCNRMKEELKDSAEKIQTIIRPNRISVMFSLCVSGVGDCYWRRAYFLHNIKDWFLGRCQSKQVSSVSIRKEVKVCLAN